MPLPPLPPSLGRQVTTREFNLLEMVSRAWGGEFSAPDHRIYCFGDGVRCFDSTDLGTTGIYQRGVSTATAPVLSGTLINSTYVNLSWTISTIVGSDIVAYTLWKSIDGGQYALLVTVPFTQVEYQDFNVSAGHTYDYFVIGEPQAPGNNSPQSNVVDITTAVTCDQHLIQAGFGISMPGGSGIGNTFIGWFGQNDGVPGPGFFGATVSGQGAFLPGGTYGYADGADAIRIPFVGPYFIVYSGSSSNQGDFTSVTINGATYLSASVPYFSNAGGCGPTYWIWTGQPAGLVDGQQYCVRWTL